MSIGRWLVAGFLAVSVAACSRQDSPEPAKPFQPKTGDAASSASAQRGGMIPRAAV
jgi:hypothetical protein